MSTLGPQWSGPDPGQLVMGVNDLTHGHPTTHGDFTPHKPFEIDQHGFIYEHTGGSGGTAPRMKPSADKEAGNESARDLYRRFGGGRDSDPKVQAHWDSMPLHHVRSDTPVHTSQGYDVTEHKATGDKADGRTRINAIRESLAAGEDIKKPAWMVRQSGRLYAMDGHHRIVASREEGRETYPVRLWDRDAERNLGRQFRG